MSSGGSGGADRGIENDDLDIDRAGRLYAPAYFAGRVWRIDTDGTVRALATGLALPAGITVGVDRAGFAGGTVYVTTHTGQVVEIPDAVPPDGYWAWEGCRSGYSPPRYSIHATARSGNEPIPRTGAGRANSLAPVSGTACRFVICSMIGIAAPSSVW